METEVKVEQSDSSDDETLAVQFKSNITGGKDGGNDSNDPRMIPGTNYIDDDGDADCLFVQIKALKYRLLDAKLLTSLMKLNSMVCDLTRNFEEKNRWKLFQLIVLLKCAVNNILQHGVITRWDWDYTLKEVMKVRHKKYSAYDIRIKTIEILDWLVEKHPDIVIGWKVGAHDPLPEADVMSDEEVAMETERDKEEFVVVKAEEDDPLTSMKNIGLDENTEEDEESASLDAASLDATSLNAASLEPVPVSLEPVSLDSIKTEEEEVEPTQSQGGEIPVEAIKTEVEAGMETEIDTGERFFHNGEELDLEDVLDRSPKHSDTEDNKKKTESDSEGEGLPAEEKEEEEDGEKDDEDEYIPDESEEDDDEASEEEEKKQDDEEEEEDDDEDDDEDEEDDEEDSKAGNVSTSLTMLKQALMRKRGQSHALLTSGKGSDGLSGAKNYTIPKVTPVDMKPSDPNIGGTTLNFSDLSDLERTVLESAVAGRMSMFKSTICTVEEREKKMGVWKDIAARVNNVVRGKLWTPEELVTIWSKKLFIEHVGSKKSLIVNKVDQLLNGDNDKTAFKSLISKSQNSSAADSIQFTIPGHPQTSSHCQTKFGPVQPILGAVKKRELTPEESAVLQEQVDIYKEMFHTKREDVRTKIWKEITKKVNAVDPRTYRTVDELKRRWTKDLIQAKLKLSSSVGHRSSGRPNTGYVIEKSKPSSEASASMSVPDSDLPIKIELDNAESDQTQILSVVPSSSSSTIRSILNQPKVSTQPSSSSKVPSTSTKSSSAKRSTKTSVPMIYGRTPPLKERPLSSKTTHQADSDPSASLARLKRGPPRLTTVTSTELVLYQLTDKTTMVRSSVTVPKACVRLQLVDKSQSGAGEVKEEPADDTVFTPDQYKVLTRLIQQKIDVIKLTGPSIVSLVLNSTDWEKLVKLVNKADLTHVHSVPNVKTKVRTIVTSLDNLLSMKNKKPGNNEEPSPSHTEDPDIPPIIPAKKIKVELHDSLVNPRWAKGDMVKAKHEACWIEGTIVDIDEDECRAKIHFHGLSRQNNRWLPMTKDFITESTRCIVKLPKLPRKI